MTRLLALDFDGVLSDSLLEAYLITWRVCGKLDPPLCLGNSLPDLDDIRAFRDRRRAHWEAFSRLVPFGNRGEDYLVIQSAVARGWSGDSQQEFDDFRREHFPAALLEAFHEEFYRERWELAARDHRAWLGLSDFYPGIPTALRRLAERFTLAIATSKDARSVGELLESHGVAGLFDREAILDKSLGESKRVHLERLRERYGCRYRDLTFVDDKVAHLLDVQELGTGLFLAGWGYNGPREHAQARVRGIPVLSLEEFPLL